MTTLLIATRNAHKVTEIRVLLGDRFEFLTLADFPAAPKVIEDATTFAGNAAKKAIELAHWLASGNSKLQIQKLKPGFVLADDSGLEVDALDGAPGVHSARFAAPDKNENSTDAANNAKLLRLLINVPLEKRTARFHCAVAIAPVLPAKIENRSPVCFADELESQTQMFDGACAGKIIFEPRGPNGFGYDPLFVPDGFDRTFAELGKTLKNSLSHRANALAKLRRWLPT